MKALQETVDFAAVGRVAKHADLSGIRLVKIAANCEPDAAGALIPSVSLVCEAAKFTGKELEVKCTYAFTARVEKATVAEATIVYLLMYAIKPTTEAPTSHDLAEFARANGALHSWPFVRELLHGLTSRMGYPPFTLPTMHFSAKPKPPKQQIVESTDKVATS